MLSTNTPTKVSAWQRAISNMFTNMPALLAYLSLDPKDLAILNDHDLSFPIRVTRHFARRMQKGNPHDPLLRQVLATAHEDDDTAGYTLDPLEEANANPIPGLLHKYAGRVLLITTQACAIHCRYCFRRTFDYNQNRQNRAHWDRAFDYIAKRPAIHEVILSGGDPLMLNDAMLAFFIEKLHNIAHVNTIRIHTRMPIVLPERITESLVALLSQKRFKWVMVIHSNHAQEIDPSVHDALTRLHQSGLTLLNQTVLLKGINDDADTLIALSQRLFQANVLPYYLHLLDPVTGTAHFNVPQEKAITLMHALRDALPGYLVPTLVKEEANHNAKTAVEL